MNFAFFLDTLHPETHTILKNCISKLLVENLNMFMQSILIIFTCHYPQFSLVLSTHPSQNFMSPLFCYCYNSFIQIMLPMCSWMWDYALRHLTSFSNLHILNLSYSFFFYLLLNASAP